MRLQRGEQKDARTGQTGTATSVDARGILNENRRKTSLLHFPTLDIISCQNSRGPINLDTVPLLEPPRNHLLSRLWTFGGHRPYLRCLQVFPYVKMFTKKINRWMNKLSSFACVSCYIAAKYILKRPSSQSQVWWHMPFILRGKSLLFITSLGLIPP